MLQRASSSPVPSAPTSHVTLSLAPETEAIDLGQVSDSVTCTACITAEAAQRRRASPLTVPRAFANSTLQRDPEACLAHCVYLVYLQGTPNPHTALSWSLNQVFFYLGRKYKCASQQTDSGHLEDLAMRSLTLIKPCAQRNSDAKHVMSLCKSDRPLLPNMTCAADPCKGRLKLRLSMLRSLALRQGHQRYKHSPNL